MLRIEGRNIADKDFDGTNVRDMETGKMSGEGAKLIAETIKKAIAPVVFDKSNTNKNALSSVSSDLITSIEKNTLATQEVLQESEDTTEEFKKLLKIMADAQEKTGEASVAAIKETIRQIERLKLSSDNPEKINKALNLDAAQEKLGKQFGPQTIGGAIFQKIFDVDLRKEKASSALSAEKLFGTKPASKDTVESLKAQVSVEKAAADKAENIRKTSELITGTEETSDKEPKIKTKSTDTISAQIEKNAEGGNVFSTGIDRESLDNKKVELLEDILAELKEMSSGGRGLGLPPGMDLLRNGKPPNNTKPSRFSRLKRFLGFADDVPVNPASVKPTLKPGFKLNSAGNPYNASNGRMVSPKDAFTNVADDVARAGTNVADDVVRGSSTASKVLGGTGRFLSKAAIPLTVGMGAYEGYTGYQDADQLVESGATNEETGQAFTEQDETAGKVEAVTKAAGGTAGAIAGGTAGATYGATAGAAIGSLFFGVGAAPGAAIGAFLGGAIGGTLGYFGGSAAGEAIGDAATTTSGEAALDAAIESGLYDKDWVGNSEIDPEILKETTDTAQLQAILHDDDLSNDDKALVAERLQELGNSTIESDIPNPQGLEGEVLKEYQRLYTEEKERGGFYKTRQHQADLALEANMIVEARTKTRNQKVRPSVTDAESTTSYSSDDAMQMGPGDVKAYDTQLEEINNSDMSETRKRAKRRSLEAKYRAKFGGTPQELEARKAYNQMQQERSVTPSVSTSTTTDSSDNLTGTPPGVYEAGIRTKDADGNSIPLSEEEQSQVDMARSLKASMSKGNSVTPSVSTNRNENSNAVDPKLKELNQKAVDAEIAYSENPSEENYKAMADATLKSDEYILEKNVPNANELVNMAPSDPSRMLMTGSDSGNSLERIETSVTPTADAVGNMTEASGGTTNNVTNIYNTTNNNGGSQSQPILVMPSSVRNNDNSFRSYQTNQTTR